MKELPEKKQAEALEEVAKLGQERKKLLEALKKNTELLRPASIKAYQAGADGTRIIELASISRATLYGWVPTTQRQSKR